MYFQVKIRSFFILTHEKIGMASSVKEETEWSGVTYFCIVPSHACWNLWTPFCILNVRVNRGAEHLILSNHGHRLTRPTDSSLSYPEFLLPLPQASVMRRFITFYMCFIFMCFIFDKSTQIDKHAICHFH